MTRLFLLKSCLKPRIKIPRETYGDCSEACTSVGGEARIPFSELRETFRSVLNPDGAADALACRRSSDGFDRLSQTDWDSIIQSTALPPGSRPASYDTEEVTPFLRVRFNSTAFADSQRSRGADLHGILLAERHAAAYGPRVSTGSGWNECGALDEPGDMHAITRKAAEHACGSSDESSRIMSTRGEPEEAAAGGARWSRRKLSHKLSCLLTRQKRAAHRDASGDASFTSSHAPLTEQMRDSAGSTQRSGALRAVQRLLCSGTARAA